MSFISGARSAHHLADGHEEKGDLPGAEAALGRLLDGPLPPKKDAAEVREVLADTRARLADLRSRRGDFDAALKDVDQGLGLVPEQSYFRGHLFETRGLVEERRTKALAAAGDQAGAGQAKERALAAFEEAMRIQQGVIKGSR
jgi:tetratricopeptide (TPR) repeat protein